MIIFCNGFSPSLAQSLKTLYETCPLEKNICLVTVFLLSLVDKEVLYVDEKVIM